MREFQIRNLVFTLTQDKDLCGGLHRCHTVSGTANPHTVVVLNERLQQQRPIGFDGVSDATS